MRKPLLSDDVLEELERERLARTPVKFGYYAPDEERAPHEPSASFEAYEARSAWEEETYHGYQEGQTIRIPVEPSLVESRRIESVKKEAFSAKLNKILFWIVVLLILFLIAVFYL